MDELYFFVKQKGAFMEQNHILENKNRSPRPIRILGIAPYKGMKAIMQGYRFGCIYR